MRGKGKPCWWDQELLWPLWKAAGRFTGKLKIQLLGLERQLSNDKDSLLFQNIQSLVPGNYVTTFNSSSMASAVFWPPQAPLWNTRAFTLSNNFFSQSINLQKVQLSYRTAILTLGHIPEGIHSA